MDCAGEEGTAGGLIQSRELEDISFQSYICLSFLIQYPLPYALIHVTVSSWAMVVCYIPARVDRDASGGVKACHSSMFGGVGATSGPTSKLGKKCRSFSTTSFLSVIYSISVFGNREIPAQSSAALYQYSFAWKFPLAFAAPCRHTRQNNGVMHRHCATQSLQHR